MIWTNTSARTCPLSSATNTHAYNFKLENVMNELGRLQVELESGEALRGLTDREIHSECLRVCAREGLSLRCVDYLSNYLIRKHGGKI